MISLPSLIFLAQATMVPASAFAPVVTAPHRVHRLSGHHAHTDPSPSPSPQVRITIVNATSVSSIALSTAGTNFPVDYPSFPQGTWTANAPLKTPLIDFLVRSTNGLIVADLHMSFPLVSSQYLLLTGDLSTLWPPDRPPQLGLPPAAEPQPWSPNLQFHCYPFATDTKELCCYRVVNGMPSKLLILRSIAEANKPARQLALLAPGNSALFTHQPRNLEWEAEIDGRLYKVAITQEGDQKNCLIPFFLRNGSPTFIRVFENR